MVQSLLWEGDLMPESQASSMSALRDRNPQPEVATRLKRLLTLLLVLTALIFPGSIRTESNPIYLDPQQPIERRVEDLLSGMTLEEKVGQLNLPCVYVDQLGKTIPEKMQACKRFAAGTYTNEIGPGAGFFTLADTILHEGAEQQAEYFNELQKIALKTRLKIPLLEDEEGTHGGMFSGATVFPEGLPSAAHLICPLWNQSMQRLRVSRGLWESMSSRRWSWNLIVIRGWAAMRKAIPKTPILARALPKPLCVARRVRISMLRTESS